MPKAQQTRGLSSAYQSNFFRSCHKFLHKSFFKFLLQNLDEAFTSKSQPNISISTKSKAKILTKPSFRILAKIQLRNLNQTSPAK